MVIKCMYTSRSAHMDNVVLLYRICRKFIVIALRWIPQDLADDLSPLVQIMAWRRQAITE